MSLQVISGQSSDRLQADLFMVKDSLIPFDSHKILKLAEKMKWDEAIIDGSSKVQNYLLNAIMVIEKKNSLRAGFNLRVIFITFSL